MFNFNLKTAKIFQAVKWERNPIFRFARFLKKLFLVLFIITFLTFIYGFFSENFSSNLVANLFGLSIIFLILSIINALKESFLNLKLKQPRLRLPGFGLRLDEVGLRPTKSPSADEVGGQAKLIDEALKAPEKYNLAEFLSFEIAKAVQKSIEFAKSEISSNHLFYFLLVDNPDLNFIFFRVLLNLKEIKKILETNIKIQEKGLVRRATPEGLDQELFLTDFQEVILESLKIAQEKGKDRVEIGEILIALAVHNPIFQQILIENKLQIEDIKNLVWWLEDLKEKMEEGKRFWEWKNLIKKGSLAKEWSAGYTVLLDKFSIDITEMLKRQGFPDVIGHQKEIETMERILARTELNNVLIVGEPGSGRKSMIQAIAKKSALGESLPEINYKRVVQLDLSTILTQTESLEEVENVLDNIFREVISAGNIILVIDEFHNFVGLPGLPRPGAIDISGIIAPYLPLPSFQIIAITTFDGLHKNIEHNPSVLSLFEKVEVSEISQRETLMLLEDLALRLEARYKKFVSYPALRDIIIYCDKYLPATPFPEKAMELLDEVMVYVSQIRDKVVLPSHVAKIVSQKTQIPVGEIEIKEREILLNLESLIHQRIINQEEAVNEISAALRRARAEVSVRKGTIGSFLFLGPTGVGKTETAKALAEIYFGSENLMIRLDMSEFQNVSDISRLIGSETEEGLLTTQVRENPFSLILLDEIEKAHLNILNLFLQVLDEGHLTDGLGRKVDFKNSIIIATSNAGYQVILEALKKKTEWSQLKEKLLDYVFEKGIFRPEFINRFDGVIVFKSLTKENLLDIAELMLKKMKKGLAEKQIKFLITQPLKEKIVELSYDPTFGARNMQRVIQDKVGNVLANAILSEKLVRGNRVEIDPQGFKLKINP